MARMVIIPARLASQRFPNKLLKDDTGWPLIRHGYERCRQVPGVDRVVVAADGEQMASVVRGFAGEVVLTDPDLPSGTDRVAAAARAIGLDPEHDLIVNVQGDEPEIEPAHVGMVFDLLADDPAAQVATLATVREDPAGFNNPNRVKVVRSETGDALYFSRAPVPYREAGAESGEWLLHVGVYGFRPAALWLATSRSPSPLEGQERLEQLRFLEMGLRIRVGIIDSAASGIDTPEDYQSFVARYRREHDQQAGFQG